MYKFIFASHKYILKKSAYVDIPGYVRCILKTYWIMIDFTAYYCFIKSYLGIDDLNSD